MESCVFETHEALLHGGFRERLEPQSIAFGWQPKRLVQKARKQMPTSIGAIPKESYSPAAQRNRTPGALRGVAEMLMPEKAITCITAATEHKANSTLRSGSKHGIRVPYLPVQTNGLVRFSKC